MIPLSKPVKIIMAGLAHPHGTNFLKSALECPNVSVLGFYDPDNPENVKKASEEFGAPVCSSLEELFSLGANTLLTARINRDKPEYIIKALQKGIGVIADKPLATTFDDLNKIKKAISISGAPLYLMLTERFGGAVNTAKTIIDRGDIGTVAQIYLVRPHRLKPEKRPEWMMFHPDQYGGIINDIGVHDFDLIRYLSGREIDKVLAADDSALRFGSYPGFHDNGSAFVTLKGGGTACVAVNWLTPDAYPAHGDTRFFIIGTKGAIDILTVENKVRWYSDLVSETFEKITDPKLTCIEDALLTMSDPDHQPMISTDDGILATEIALIAQNLADSNHK